MRYQPRPRFPFWILFTLNLLLTGVPGARGQSAGVAASEVSPDAKVFAETVRQLQAQIEALSLQVSELRNTQESTLQEVKALRAELGRAALQSVAKTAGTNDASQSESAEIGSSAATPAVTKENHEDAAALDERVAKLEEAEELLNDKVTEQSQTKVESGSKYRVRFSGIVLLNAAVTRGAVDNVDFPQLAVPQESGGGTNANSGGAFTGSLRQSQIGVEAFGPDIAGARTSANVRFDFAGGFPNQANGTAFGVFRLRTGTIRLDWENTSVVAGQDGLFFAPLTPTTLSSLAIPALSYSGNLWSWTPQIRVEHRIALTEHTRLSLQAGILDQLTGEYAVADYREPTAGERSGQPAYATRIALTTPFFGRPMTFGVGGYYGRQNWLYGGNVDGWAGVSDVTLPLGSYFDLSAEFYRGRGVGGLGGGIGQSVLVGGTLNNPEGVVRGLDAIGGWGQLKFKPRNNFEINLAYGQDDPFASELRAFPASAIYYGTLLSRNQSPFVNFIYRARSDILFSAQYQRLRTFTLDSASNQASPSQANQVTLSMGYVF
jgi:hypothetical protein